MALLDRPGHDDLWQRHAACNGVGLEVFFPEGQGDPGYRAKKVCATCPVRTDCLSVALVSSERWGVWGGAGEGLRRRLGRLLRASPHPERGVIAGCRCEFDQAVVHHFERLDEFARIGKRQRGRVNLNGPGVTHGIRATYNRGCTCDECEAAVGTPS